MHPPAESRDEEKERIVARRKAQLRLTALIMTGSFCIGTTILFLILWLLLK